MESQKHEKFEIQNQNGTGDGMREKTAIFNAAPDDRSHMTHSTSDFGALLHVIKSSLGTGILAMPFAFKNAGLFVGLIGCVVTGLLVTHTTAMLINCSQNLCRIFGKNSMSYVDTAEYAFLHTKGGRWKNHAYKARCLVNSFLFITYYGVNISYVLLIAETVEQVVHDFTGTSFPLRWYTVGSVILIYPLGIVRFMKFLVPFSALANTLLLLSLGLVFRHIFEDLPELHTQPAAKSISQLPMFISTVFVSMEGIGTIMPVENEMRNPKRLIHPPGLLYIGMTCVILLNTSVGFFGYLKYGDEAKAAISLNLPNDWLSQLIKLTIAMVVLFTFGLQMTVSVKVIWDALSPSLDEGSSKNYYIVRTSMIFGTVIIATLIPSLGGVIGLLGSIGFSVLGIFLPALIELVYYSENYGFLRWRLVKNVFLMLFAILCGTVGTYCSILELFHGKD